MGYQRYSATVNYPVLHTYRDVLEHLQDYTGGLPQEVETRRGRGVIQEAYRDIAAFHKWKYFRAQRRVLLNESYATGTVAYDHTGGASERLVTLTDGTFPDWARYGTMLIGSSNAVYKVATRESNTTATLDESLNPGQDIAAGATFTIYRSRYPLPNDIIHLWAVNDENGWWSNGWVAPDDWMQLERHDSTSDASGFHWTIMGDPDNYGSLSLFVWPYPNDDYLTLDYICTRRPRRLVYDGYSLYSSSTSGQTISTFSAAATTTTLTGFTLSNEAIGSVIRFARSGASAPPDGANGPNPFLMQKVVRLITTAGSIVTFDSAAEYANASTHFAISDPVDLPEYLLNAFYRRVELLWCLRFRKDMVALAQSAWDEAIRYALSQDAVAPALDSLMQGWQPFYLEDNYTVSSAEWTG